MRVHWATFDTNDKGSYNMNNCLMAARLLNANVTARAKAEGKEELTRSTAPCRPVSPKHFPLTPDFKA
jgi:hypothetical protein